MMRDGEELTAGNCSS